MQTFAVALAADVAAETRRLPQKLQTVVAFPAGYEHRVMHRRGDVNKHAVVCTCMLALTLMY